MRQLYKAFHSPCLLALTKPLYDTNQNGLLIELTPTESLEATGKCQPTDELLSMDTYFTVDIFFTCIGYADNQIAIQFIILIWERVSVTQNHVFELKVQCVFTAILCRETSLRGGDWRVNLSAAITKQWYKLQLCWNLLTTNGLAWPPDTSLWCRALPQ